MSQKDLNPALSSCSTGLLGFDTIIGGGLPRGHMYLLQGRPGTGKTTLAMQFLLEGVRLGEKALYITFSETQAELQAVARSHGWDISKISILDLSAISADVVNSTQNTLFHSSEVELNKTVQLLFKKIEEAKASRIVLDSLSELRLLAESSLKYRRQVLAFKEFFINKGATIFLLDDLTGEAGDLHVQSVVHGVMYLEKIRAAYGVERREFHISKLRGVSFKGGSHDYLIKRGGIQIFPRLVASEHRENSYERERFSTGNENFDRLLGGGLDRGTSNLILGPAGSGKSTLALKLIFTAVAEGKRVAIFNFEENIENLLNRAAEMSMDLRPFIAKGTLTLQKVDPAELTPGQFTSLVRGAGEGNADMIVIDSLNGYVHAMPEAQFLILQLHELLAYLGNRGVITILVLSQSGIMSASMSSPLDLTYLADTVVLTRFFEAFGRIKKAISVIKKRTGAHEETLREYVISSKGVELGKVLSQFSGIFSGMPKFLGGHEEILGENDET